jgi:hypothetical protein
MQQATTFTAKDIHADFFGAEERLYLEAVCLVKDPQTKKVLYSERFNKIGFGKCKAVQEAMAIVEKHKLSEKLIESIEYFRLHYPSYRYITEAEVKILCGKYGLLLGDSANFIGEVPEKNLVDIEKFKLRKDDWIEGGKSGSIYDGARLNSFAIGDEAGLWATGIDPISTPQRGTLGLVHYFRPSRQSGLNQWIAEYLGRELAAPPPSGAKRTFPKEQPPFKICAPIEDFDRKGYEIRDGYRLVWDPIVLQPVSHNNIPGYLIVTAWGDEATDPMVVNSVKN